VIWQLIRTGLSKLLQLLKSSSKHYHHDKALLVVNRQESSYLHPYTAGIENNNVMSLFWCVSCDMCSAPEHYW